MTCATGALASAHFSTEEIAPASRLGRWREAVAGLYDVTDADDAEGFSGTASGLHLGSLIIGEMDAMPATYERSRKRIRRDGLDHLVFGVSGENGQGRITVQDMSQPVEMPATALAGFCVIAPRHLAQAHKLAPAHGSATANAAGGLLTTLLTSIAGSAAHLPAGSADPLARAVLELLTAALGCEGDNPSPVPRLSRRAAARAYIEANLADPSLSPATVARESGVSRSVLYNLFGECGGVAKYITSRRLAWASRLLTHRNDLRISEIAALCCFSSESQFSRAFRTWSGTTPTDARRGLQFVPPAIGDRPQSLAFSHWVQTLGSGR